MKTITQEVKLYRYDELNEEAKYKASISPREDLEELFWSSVEEPEIWKDWLNDALITEGITELDKSDFTLVEADGMGIAKVEWDGDPCDLVEVCWRQTAWKIFEYFWLELDQYGEAILYYDRSWTWIGGGQYLSPFAQYKDIGLGSERKARKKRMETMEEMLTGAHHRLEKQMSEELGIIIRNELAEATDDRLVEEWIQDDWFYSDGTYHSTSADEGDDEKARHYGKRCA